MTQITNTAPTIPKLRIIKLKNQEIEIENSMGQKITLTKEEVKELKTRL